MANKIKKIIVALVLLLTLAVSFQHKASAVSCTPGTDGCVCSSQGCDNGVIANPSSTTASTGDCKDTTNAAGNPTTGKIQKCLDNNQLVKDLQVIVNFLSAAVGILIIGVIILGGIQYTLAGDNAQAVSAAKQRIINGLIALAAFLFTFAFLQWLIPGGIFS